MVTARSRFFIVRILLVASISFFFEFQFYLFAFRGRFNVGFRCCIVRHTLLRISLLLFC